MWWGYDAAGKAVSGGARLGSRIGALGAMLPWRGLRGRTYLGPGDTTPLPTGSADFLDYRGIATWREARISSMERFR